MRVLSVIHYPTFGGPHNRNANVIPALSERGIHTTIALPDDPGNAYDYLDARGVAVIRLPLSRLRAVRHLATHGRYLIEFTRDVKRLRQVIRRLDIDLVLVNGLINAQGAIAARLEGVPLVWQLLDTFPPRALRAAMMPMVTVLADALMSSGRAVAEQHPGAVRFGDRLVPFFSVVDTDRFENSAEARAAARERLGLPQHAVVIGNVNNVNPMKGHDLFIRAAGVLARVRPETRFVILGARYPQHEQYMQGLLELAGEVGLRVGENLLFHDPGTAVEQYAAAFDCFWLTSRPRSEGVSTVVGEAMSLGLPVVATRVGSVPEAVADGVTGVLVDPDDPQAIVDASVPFVDDPELRASVGLAGRARALELYSQTACADRHEYAFRRAVEHRRTRQAAARRPSRGNGRA